MPFEQENHVERNATNPTPGTAAIAQQAWAPRTGQENTAAPAPTQSDMQKALDQGLAAVGNLFGGIFHGAENGVKAVGNEAQQVGSPQPATQAAEQQSQQAAKQSTPSESSAPATQESNGLQQFGSGIVKGLGDMFNEAGGAIGYAVTHPVETLVKAEQVGEKIVEKAGETFVGALGTAEHVGEQIGSGDFNGLRDDVQKVGKSIENGWNTAVKGVDYLVSATPEQKGEFLGHYVLPEIAIGLATEGIGNAAMGAAMGAMGMSEAALGAGIAVTGATEAGIAMTGTTEMAIGFTGVSEAGIALTEETEVAVNLLGTASESGLMQAGKAVLKTVAEAVEDGEKGVEGAVKKVKEGFDHAHETIKKAAEVADDAGKASSAERASEEVGKIAATTMPSAESTLPSLKIVEHSAHNTSDFTEVDRLFGKNSKPITDPKEFERQIAELTRNFEHSAKQTPNNLTSEERIIADAIHDLQKNIQPAADDDNVFSILERKAAIAV